MRWGKRFHQWISINFTCWQYSMEERFAKHDTPTAMTVSCKRYAWATAHEHATRETLFHAMLSLPTCWKQATKGWLTSWRPQSQRFSVESGFPASKPKAILSLREPLPNTRAEPSSYGGKVILKGTISSSFLTFSLYCFFSCPGIMLTSSTHSWPRHSQWVPLAEELRETKSPSISYLPPLTRSLRIAPVTPIHLCRLCQACTDRTKVGCSRRSSSPSPSKTIKRIVISTSNRITSLLVMNLTTFLTLVLLSGYGFILILHPIFDCLLHGDVYRMYALRYGACPIIFLNWYGSHTLTSKFYVLSCQ